MCIRGIGLWMMTRRGNLAKGQDGQSFSKAVCCWLATHQLEGRDRGEGPGVEASLDMKDWMELAGRKRSVAWDDCKSRGVTGVAGGTKVRVAQEDKEPCVLPNSNPMLHFVRAVDISTQCLAAF